jgi:exosome complex component RRP4
MNNEPRQLVLPGDAVGDKRSIAGPGTKKVGDKLVAITAGILQAQGEKVSILPMNGCYEPKTGDQVIGIVTEANTGNWIVDIRAPWLAPLHVSEVPWRVDFGETMNYLKPGDAILCKVLFVDEQKKVQVTLKDRNLSKLEEGELFEVPPSKVARVIGKNGAMLNLLKEYIECWLFVGQNGRLWLNGQPQEILLAQETLRRISDGANIPGLTERIKAFLESQRPGGLDAGLVVERKITRVDDEPAPGREEGKSDDEAPREADSRGGDRGQGRSIQENEGDGGRRGRAGRDDAGRGRSRGDKEE